ncbi:UNVERIFIED_CONTAM: hypothetical protein Sindi_0634600 [Sesamum indicum]
MTQHLLSLDGAKERLHLLKENLLEEGYLFVVMNARIAARLLASEGTTEKLVAATVEPSATPSLIRGREVPDSEGTCAEEAPETYLNLDQDSAGDNVRSPSPSPKKRPRSGDPSPQLKKRSGSSKSSKSAKIGEVEPSLGQGKLALEAADLNYELLQEVQGWWREARKELKCDHHKTEKLQGERFVPKWNISAESTVLYGEAGQASWEIYSKTQLPRDQASIMTTSHTRVEEHLAHTLMQASALSHNMALKCTSHRRDHLTAVKKLEDLRRQFAEKESGEKALVAENESLKGQLAELSAELENVKGKAFSDGRREGVLAGREEGMEEGYETGRLDGIWEGRFDRIHIEEHKKVLAEARFQAARDFLRSAAFLTAVEMKAARFFIDGFNTCKAQANTLHAFAKKLRSRAVEPWLG